jgi:peptidoglycan-associated lipoprotein
MARSLLMATNMRKALRPSAWLRFAATAAIIALLASACGNDKQVPPQTPSDVATKAPAPPPADVTPNTPTAANVAVSPDILRACGLSADQAFFAFDSAHLGSGDRTPLDAVATCFTRGPLAGRSMKLIGRADPRGTADYNMTLGLSRADAVAAYLDSHGLPASHTPTTSRGAMDATGTDESGWARDRRVDVVLAN